MPDGKATVVIALRRRSLGARSGAAADGGAKRGRLTAHYIVQRSSGLWRSTTTGARAWTKDLGEAVGGSARGVRPWKVESTSIEDKAVY